MAPHTERLFTIETCAGYGGIGLGISMVEPGYKTVCYVEREIFAAANLVAKMEEKVMDEAPVWSDLSTFDGHAWRGKVDLVTGGIPCQPFSVAGDKKGIQDERWLWPDFFRVVCEIQPQYIFLENVRGFVRAGLGHVLSDLADSGWIAEWDLFSAESVGAPHKRERLFILAHPGYWSRRPIGIVTGRKDSSGKRTANNHEVAGPGAELADTGSGKPGRISNPARECVSETGDDGELANTQRNRRERTEHTQRAQSPNLRRRFTSPCFQKEIWPANPGNFQYDWEAERTFEPKMGGAVNGITNRLDELRLCGNGVIPLVAAVAWRILKTRIHEAED